MSKLDQLEMQLKTTDPLQSSSAQVQLHSQIAQTICDVCDEPIRDGRVVLSAAANYGTEGIMKMVSLFAMPFVDFFKW